MLANLIKSAGYGKLAAEDPFKTGVGKNEQIEYLSNIYDIKIRYKIAGCPD
jgi:hypothetical protein